MRLRCSVAVIMFIISLVPHAEAGNTWNDSFNKAKQFLEKQVYHDHRRTFYCDATFDEQKNIHPLDGFITKSYVKRAEKVEWEHIVPAENFGRTFIEWREGSAECLDNKGRTFKGRKCAEKVSSEYRYMQSDMHNLVPAIGAINAARSNHNFALLPDAISSFGSCQMKIEGNKVEPPIRARGMIARTYKYMEQEYPRFNMGGPQKKLMDVWDKMYPPDEWECTRAARVAKIQGNRHKITEERCREAGF